MQIAFFVDPPQQARRQWVVTARAVSAYDFDVVLLTVLPLSVRSSPAHPHDSHWLNLRLVGQSPQTDFKSKASKDELTGTNISGTNTPSSSKSIAVFSNGTTKEDKVKQPPFSGNPIRTRTLSELSPPREKDSESVVESKEEDREENFVGAHLSQLLVRAYT